LWFSKVRDSWWFKISFSGHPLSKILILTLL
jgi:hypothetical protein